jgi:hypothetical protein
MPFQSMSIINPAVFVFVACDGRRAQGRRRNNQQPNNNTQHSDSANSLGITPQKAIKTHTKRNTLHSKAKALMVMSTQRSQRRRERNFYLPVIMDGTPPREMLQFSSLEQEQGSDAESVDTVLTSRRRACSAQNRIDPTAVSHVLDDIRCRPSDAGKLTLSETEDSFLRRHGDDCHDENCCSLANNESPEIILQENERYFAISTSSKDTHFRCTWYGDENDETEWF